MMKKFDSVVIGAGPGGYACAIRMAQLGMKVALIDKDRLGGTCLNWGCIPSKALIHVGHLYESFTKKGEDMGLSCSGLKLDFKKMMSWKNDVVGKLVGGIEGLCKRHQIEVFEGTAKFTNSNSLEVGLKTGGKESLQFDKAVIATGTTISSLPQIKPDGKQIITSNEAIHLDKLPKKMILIGGGYIGMELGCFYAMLGTEVIVLEYADQILSTTDADVAKLVEKAMKDRGAKIHTGFKVASAEVKGKKVHVTGAPAKGGDEMTFEADLCLVCVGRRPYTEGLAVDKAGVKVNEKGYIPVNKSLQTNLPHIYAIGDITEGPALAHRASHEAAIAAAHAAGDAQSQVDYKVIPAAIFTDPEVASVGITEKEAKEKGLNVKIGKFPFAALGRALANHNSEGFCKIIGDAETNDLLGMTIVGPEAGNLIAEGALAIEMGASVEDLSLTIHTHPTYPESIMEAAESYFGHAIHVYQPGHKNTGLKKASA